MNRPPVGSVGRVSYGEHMKDLGKRWKGEMRNRDKYIDIANLRKQELGAEVISHPSAEPAEQRCRRQVDIVTPWSLGDAESPLRPELASTPELPKDEAEAYMKQIHMPIAKKKLLPAKVKYDNACLPGCCQTGMAFKPAETIKSCLKRMGVNLLDVFVFGVEGRWASQIVDVAILSRRDGRF